MTETIKTDILIIGSGIAGLFFALKCAEFADVLMITKKERSDSNTNWAQGGIAAVLSPDDSYESHIADTHDAGAGLCHAPSVEILVKEGPHHVRKLIELGVEFTKEHGQLHLAKEGGHSAYRIVHAADLTGKEVERALLARVADHSRITVLEHHAAIELITEHHLKKKTNDIHCYGAYAIDSKTGVFKKILSRFTLLASGGAGHVYLHTTNPDIATGDGVAMAYRAGAEIHNMEFVQFHPTTLFHPQAKSFLITEAVRGFGGVLRLQSGEAFMNKYDDRDALAPRDIVARAIDNELKRTGDEFVYLDITHKPASDIISHFPNIYEKCLTFGIDITRDMIPVVPAAHYFCGGVATTLKGATTIHRLYACGEVSCTGVHGANRLASNSLLEALVFSDRAARDIEHHFPLVNNSIDFPDWDETGTESPEEWILISHNRKELQQIMNDYVGIVRSDLRLERARRRIEFLKEETEAYYKKTKISADLIELRNLIKVAKLVVEAAMKRRESRGLHFTTDYPSKDNLHFLKNTVLRSF